MAEENVVAVGRISFLLLLVANGLIGRPRERGSGYISVYHLHRQNVFVAVFGLLLPVPQIYVMTLETSSRWCPEPLLNLAVAGLVMTLFAIAFTFMFIILVPVPRELKIFFHITGLADLILGFITLASTLYAQTDCSTSTPELLLMSQISSALSVASAAFIVLMFPFWVINRAKPKSVLDPYSRTGVCYEPVKCCQCLWHI